MMATSQARFKWNDDKFINLIKNVYNNSKVPWDSEIASQTLTKSNYVRV